MDTREVRAAFLDEVKQAVCKDRTKSHGQPEDNFRDIAWLWTGWLRGRYHLDVDLDAIDVGYMSILLKVARAESNPVFRDHAVDTAGYAACIGGIIASETIPELAEERPATFDRDFEPQDWTPTHTHANHSIEVRVLDRQSDAVRYEARYESGPSVVWSLPPQHFDRMFTPIP